MKAKEFDLSDYAEIVGQQVNAFRSNSHDAGEAIKAAVLTYHLYEWLWKWAVGAKTPPVRDNIFHKRKDFQNWLYDKCPHFRTLERLANGSKHAGLVDSQEVEGYGEGAYGVGPFGTPHLQIRVGVYKEASAKTLAAETVICEAADFLLNLVDEVS